MPSDRPGAGEDTFRLYVDESGDHVFNRLDEPNHRFLFLLGCWLRNSDVREFHRVLEDFKQECLPHNPDEPLVLHREDILNARRGFKRLREVECRRNFDESLLRVIAGAPFTVVAVVIDQQRLKAQYGDDAAHPYHLAIGFLLQRYCGYLNHVNRRGDVMAESRGGAEDRLLKDSYSRVYERGAWMFPAAVFQRALTSSQLKLKPKSANIAGLQLADLLAHPVKHLVLR